jgi:hypothetical protein
LGQRDAKLVAVLRLIMNWNFVGWALMSALGQKRTSDWRLSMSALPPKADIRQRDRHVRFVPILLQKSVAGLFGQ